MWNDASGLLLDFLSSPEVQEFPASHCANEPIHRVSCLSPLLSKYIWTANTVDP